MKDLCFLTYNVQMRRSRIMTVKYKIAFTVAIMILLFASCSTRGAMEQFNKNKYFERAMTNLQIGTLVDKLKTKVVLQAIYLNQIVDNGYPEGEHFYIATYVDDENALKEAKRGLQNSLYILKLNGILPKSITELAKESILRQKLPITESWYKYYHVEFDDVNTTKLELTLYNKDYGTILLSYAKDELEK